MAIAQILNTQQEHTQILNSHTQLLNSHTRLLNNHTADLQIVLTQGASLSLGTENVGDCVKLNRSDYWNAEDLADFNREWKRELREDGTNFIEFTYRALRNPLVSKTEWGRYTTRYQLITDASELYHFAETLEVSLILV